MACPTSCRTCAVTSPQPETARKRLPSTRPAIQWRHQNGARNEFCFASRTWSCRSSRSDPLRCGITETPGHPAVRHIASAPGWARGSSPRVRPVGSRSPARSGAWPTSSAICPTHRRQGDDDRGQACDGKTRNVPTGRPPPTGRRGVRGRQPTPARRYSALLAGLAFSRLYFSAPMLSNRPSWVSRKSIWPSSSARSSSNSARVTKSPT